MGAFCPQGVSAFGIIVCSSSRLASLPFNMDLVYYCGLEKRVASTSVVWPVYVLTIQLLGKHQMFLEPALPWVLRGPGDSSDSRLLGQRARDLGRSVDLLGILVRRLSLLRITETIPTPGFYPNPEHSRSR